MMEQDRMANVVVQNPGILYYVVSSNQIPGQMPCLVPTVTYPAIMTVPVGSAGVSAEVEGVMPCSSMSTSEKQHQPASGVGECSVMEESSSRQEATFTRESAETNLLNNAMKHSGAEIDLCEDLDMTSPPAEYLTQFSLICKGVKNYECFHCGKNFSHKHKLVKHIVKHIDAKCHVCEACWKKFDKKRDLSRHSCKNYTCKQCGEKFITKISLKKHKKIHPVKKKIETVNVVKKVKSYKCLECGETFPLKSHLNRHTLVHTGLGNFTCEACGKIFTYQFQLTTHMKFVHSGVTNYKFLCEVCGKGCRCKSHLTTHMLTHTGIRNYECKDCGKKYLQKGQLTIHKKVHNGVKDFACDECDKKFTTNSQLTKHRAKHSVVKNYECLVCGKKYAYNAIFLRHVRTHNDDKDYECQECGKIFSLPWQLKKHAQTQHGE